MTAVISNITVIIIIVAVRVAFDKRLKRLVQIWLLGTSEGRST